jgi:hypothetical protein
MSDPPQTKPHDRNTPMNTFQAVLLQSRSSYLPRCTAVHFGDHQGQTIEFVSGAFRGFDDSSADGFLRMESIRELD